MNVLIGSTTPCSGKSALTLGLGLRLKALGWKVLYAKPLGSQACDPSTSPLQDEDCAVMAEYLQPAAPPLGPLVFLDRASTRRRLGGEDTTDYAAALRAYAPKEPGQVRLVEGPGTPQEGALFGLTLQTLAEQLPARVLLVCRYQQDLVIDELLIQRMVLGNQLLGTVLNDVPAEQIADVNAVLVPFLEKQGSRSWGTPADTVLHSLSVGELVRALGAEVLCCRDRLDLMVESFHIGAMSVNAALKYFRASPNKVVLTGGDRTDLQLAALETSTACLVLTGHLAPSPLTLARAEELEVPVLSVSQNTLGATETIDRLFGQARFRGPLKAERVQYLLERHFRFERFIACLELPQQV